MAYLGLFLLVAVIVLGLPESANADVIDLGKNILTTLAAAPILMSIGVIAVLVTVLFGAINSMIISAIVTLTSYNNFVNESSIISAWVIIRDLCNMFFILILLVIAFATILRLPSYEWKKILPKLLIMAILINFSRMFCGLIIDVSQIIMLTFVNAWAGNGSGFVVITRMTTYFTGVVAGELSKFASADYSVLNIVVGMLVGIMFLIISGIVLLVALAVFLMRVIMLWIYIVLSPLAFLASAFPAGQKYASQWWSEFIKYIINGPVLAFFIWMAFTVSAQIDKSGISFGNTSSDSPLMQCFGLTQGMCLNNFLPFIISIGMLLGGLMITQQIGGVGSSIAGKGLAWAKKSLAAPVKGLALGSKTLASYGVDKLHQKTGVDLNVSRVWSGIQEKRKELKARRYLQGTDKAAEVMKTRGRIYGALAMTGTPATAWEQLTTKQGWKMRWRGGAKSQDKISDSEREIKQYEDRIERIRDGKTKVGTEEYDYDGLTALSKAPTHEQVGAADKRKRLSARAIVDLAQPIADAEGELIRAKSSNNPITIDHAEAKLAKLQGQRDVEEEAFKRDDLLSKQKPHTDAEINQANNELAHRNGEIKSEEGKIKDKKAEISEYKPMEDFEAIAAHGALIREEMKKIDHIKDRDEKSAMLLDAKEHKDKLRYEALGLSLAHDGNENDGFLNAQGYTSNAAGLNQLTTDISTKGHENYMGFTQQEAKAMGMKISYAAEDRGHWATARAFTMENGRYRDSSKLEQTLAAVSEAAKQGPRELAKNNRLAYGGETPDGEFLFEDFGRAMTRAIGEKLSQQIDHLNPNASAYLNMPIVINSMVEAGVTPSLINELKKAAGKDPGLTPAKMVKEMARQINPSTGKRYFENV